jgi:hypothetical protein
MAKAKQHTFHLQRFFIIFGVFFSLAALGIIVYSSQQKTNTQSDASGGCKMTPQVEFVKSVGGSNNVSFYFDVKNYSEESCDKGFYYVVKKLSYPSEWKYQYYDSVPRIWGDLPYWALSPRKDGKWVAWQSYNRWQLKITPSSTVKNGTYYFPVKVCRSLSSLKDNDHDLSWTYLNSKITDQCSSISLKYVKS